MHGLALTYTALSVYSLAAQQNAYRLFANTRISYTEDIEDVADRQLYRDLTVRLDCEGGIMQPEIWELAQIGPGQHVKLQDRSLQFSHDYLLNLSDETLVKFTFSVFRADDPTTPLFTRSETLTIFPANFWGGETRQPELLAAFVKPNGVYVESLVKQVADVLESNGHGRSVDGYQSNTREKPYFMAAALWSVLANQKIAYVSPPPSFAHQGQLVRLASDISNNKMGACLDLSLLFASCLELMGLNTVITLTQTHAFVGVWLVDTMFPLLTNDEPMELRKRVDASDLILFETTMVTNSRVPTFLQACTHARSLVAEDAEEEFVYAIDIMQARARKIKPLATIEDRQDEVEAADDNAVMLPPAPPLPPVRMNERVVEESPETRIDTWQRKLLDLTKRNPLLSFKDRAAGVRIFCPDIAQLEDNLADGVTFSFISSEDSPENDRERSAESFQLATGNDLHVEYARQQLSKNVIVANMATKKLETTLINLLRKAKNDLEEGGSNTLFLAIGMLAWKDNPEDDRVFKAPLILLPVELTRRSARAEVKLRQLVDEDPLFNLTLIEFLYVEHGIDLNYLREDLPEDDSGLDVARIWQDVREAVAEQKGFEVIEECVIASFSFSKYLMWKDLRERMSDLKENPFVAHLVNHPQEAYEQSASFLPINDLDNRIDPADIFLPLNCDSSQMVAVDAASRPQDFVLEGPPGTGKSETIANMIANNIAKGRKVLFVAEKIAALQVVYRRLEKTGLDHLALELHSNKANKKAVLEQLRRASVLRESKTTDEWINRARFLREQRLTLNLFVKALHEPSAFGISPRDAIARVAGTANNQKVQFRWGFNLSDCPVVDEAGLAEILVAAKKAGIAHDDILDLDVSLLSAVRATVWSYSWQAGLIEHARQFMTMADQMITSSHKFAAQFNIAIDSPTINQIMQLKALSELVDIAQKQSIAYALGLDVLERLDRLGQLAAAKTQLDEKLTAIAHGSTAPRLVDTPVEEWITLYEEAQQSWWRKLLIKGRLNKLARLAGYDKFSDLGILYELKESKRLVVEIERLSEEFIEHKIWVGWHSKPEDLQIRQNEGRQIHGLIKSIVSLSNEPAEVLSTVKSQLIDGREFLDVSKLVAEKYAFDTSERLLTQAVEDLTNSRLELDVETPLKEHAERLEWLINNEFKLKPWVEWVAAKELCEGLNIESLAEALESGNVLKEEAEDQVYTAFCAWLAPRLIDSREELRGFKASEHNSLINDFRLLDEKVAKTTGEYIAAVAAQNTPDIKSKEHASNFGTLSRELQKKTRHKPIRVLFEDVGECLLDLTPCMMMSPLSVAQFLPSDFNAFDVVIFDEASQMTTWDSVGAIARGKNVIVVGDPKQMPPTNFFNATVDPDVADEEDLESILDQALAAGLPHIRLMGHYRSRHESLIAFSNSKYYENALVTYPASDTKASAVVLRRVAGIYAKGKGRNNSIEAQAVVAEVVRRLTHPELSKLTLGIVTLNTEQQRTIEDLLDDARRSYPKIEAYFQSTDDYDGVFVKNLESVQGDERDVIMFSVGYGPTELGAKTMSMNFGPLNKAGGERRLNVAITRATTELLIFTSFDSHMVDLSRSSSLAVEHLKHYIEFAERGPIALAEQSTAADGVDPFNSDLEQAVAVALGDLGWRVQTQVGVSKFRVDLGVVHPDMPELYLAGIECDGATYHSSPNARDRDRTRHSVLENLGWRLVRLWSTDYFQDSSAAIAKIHTRLNEILVEDRERRSQEAEGIENQEDLEDLEDLDSALDSSLYTPLVAKERHVSTNAIVAEEVMVGEDSLFPSSDYFLASHEPILASIAKEILAERPCITQKTLAVEIAERHGLSRTSEKQQQHLKNIVEPWAGVWRDDIHQPVYWLSPEDVQGVVAWRGVSPWDYRREWKEIAYPEILGLAKEAVERKPGNPVEYICDQLEIRQRHPATIEIFETWVEAYKTL